MKKYDCRSLCQHGGVCILEKDHAGSHTSNYCAWSDEEAITREEAYRIMLKKAGPKLARAFDKLYGLGL